MGGIVCFLHTAGRGFEGFGLGVGMRLRVGIGIGVGWWVECLHIGFECYGY